MEKQIIKVEKVAIAFSDEEKRKLIQLLKYCRHRFEYHPEAGIHQMAVEKPFVDYLLSNI